MVSTSQHVQSIKKQIAISLVVIGVGLISFSNNGYASGIQFPRTKTVRDSSDVLKVYQPYFDFAIAVGKSSDLMSAQKLEKSFNELKNRNPEAAARFLKGLRFEMMDKAERMGRKESLLSSSNPEIQKWVGRFVKEWAREADEHLYRVYSTQIAKK